MSEMSLEQQINCMQEMRSYLEDFCCLMQRTMDDLNDDVTSLRNQGLPKETEQQYRQEYYASAQKEVDQVIGDIYNLHFDYLDRVIEKLQRALNER